MLIDSHSHLNFQAFEKDLAEVIKRCQQTDMKVINVGAALNTSQKAIALARENKNFYAAIGLHPIHVYDEEFAIKIYQKLIDDNKNKIVAIGETGFDYYHLEEILKKSTKSIKEIQNKQKEVFLQHIELAKSNNLAVIVHGRNGKDKNAYQDIYQVLKEADFNRGAVHCFGGNLAEAKQLVELGFYLGFTGILTFDKTGVVEEIAKWIPEDKILIETDAPFLAPVPYRGKRNEPAFVKHVAEKLAEVRNKSVEEMIELTGNNAIKLFNLK